MLVKPQMQELKNKFKDILMQKFMPLQEVHYLLHSPVNMIDKLSKQSPIIHMLKVQPYATYSIQQLIALK
jgi:hypothetical protein